MEILHSVIHGFDKVQHEPVGLVVKKDLLLDCKLPAVISLANGVLKLLGNKTNNQAWGHFGNDGREGLFPGQFEQFIPIKSDAGEFLKLSHLVVDEMVKSAGLKPLATGGRILFSMFDDDITGPLFLIAMIKQKGGVILDEDFVPIGITEIDLSKLHQAAKISINNFIDVKNSDDDADIDRNYLSFLSPKAANGAAGYFVIALGCVIGMTADKSTDQLFKAVYAFFTQNTVLNASRRKAKEDVTGYLEKQFKAELPASLEEICLLLERAAPPEHNALFENLNDFLNGPQYKIPDEFFVSKKYLTVHSKITLDDDRMNFKFIRADLGTTDQATIKYDKEAKSLTIRNLSKDFMDKLDKTLAGSE